MKQLLITCCIILLAAGCKKELLDIDAGICFSVKDLLNSRNADVACGNAADFEGKVLCLTGTLDAENGMGLPQNFFLHDESRSLEIQIDSTIAASVIALVTVNRGRFATVKGVLTGFDKPQNFNCRRGFVQHLSDIEDLEIR